MFPVQLIDERMEPERKIEKLLRAFAKKRRADAVDFPKLPPAMRRRLQDEAAKRFAEPAEEDSLSLWQLFRQQWAVLLGFALVIFFVGTMFAPSLTSAKKRAQSTLAQNHPKPAELAGAGFDEERMVVNSAKAGADRKAPATSPDRRSAPAASPVVLAANPAPAGEATVVGGKGARREDSDVGKATLASADKPAEPAAIYAGGSSDGLAAAVEQKQLFKAKNAPVAGFSAVAGNAQRFRQSVPAAQIPPVLVSFELQQNGSAIAIVDGDGSVYNGTLAPADSSFQNTVTMHAAPMQKDAAGRGGPAAATNAFRVEGRNRTSGQNIVFNGNLIQVASTNAWNTNASPALWLLNNSRITGAVTVDATNQIEINAVPVP